MLLPAVLLSKALHRPFFTTQPLPHSFRPDACVSSSGKLSCGGFATSGSNQAWLSEELDNTNRNKKLIESLSHSNFGQIIKLEAASQFSNEINCLGEDEEVRKLFMNETRWWPVKITTMPFVVDIAGQNAVAEDGGLGLKWYTYVEDILNLEEILSTLEQSEFDDENRLQTVSKMECHVPLPKPENTSMNEHFETLEQIGERIEVKVGVLQVDKLHKQGLR
ncbi:hypothetical protein L1887_36438 [Cichorium endivia]|nr:hypothetical protein L1887_36438 [Cichorium endivia]